MRDRLGDVPLLSQGPAAGRRRRPRRPQPARQLGAPGAGGRPAAGSGFTGDGAESTMSAATTGAPGLLLMLAPTTSGRAPAGLPALSTRRTLGGDGASAVEGASAAGAGWGARTALTQPDHVKLPEEYNKVSPLLKAVDSGTNVAMYTRTRLDAPAGTAAISVGLSWRGSDTLAPTKPAGDRDPAVQGREAGHGAGAERGECRR